MSATNHSGLKLGINGFGRIGKLTLWHHVARKYFPEIVVNIGRRKIKVVDPTVCVAIPIALDQTVYE